MNVTRGAWEAHFLAMFRTESPPILQLGGEVRVEELDERITENEVRIAIERGKNGKAAGPYCSTNKCMKDCPDVLLVTITGMFNYCFDNACCPSVWNTSY